MRDKTLGNTAPQMTATAAEKWRASYRRYRHRKHLEKKIARQRANSGGDDAVAGKPEKLTTHRERKIHRHIREIARPHSIDRSGNASSHDPSDGPPPPPKGDLNV